MSDVATHPRIVADVGRIWAYTFREFYAEAGSPDEAILVSVTKTFARAMVRGDLPARPEERCQSCRGYRYPKELREMVAIAADAMERLDGPSSSGWPLTPTQYGVLPIVDWIRSVRQDDPRRYAKLPRMNYQALWQAQDRWHAALAKRKTEAAAVDLASCPVLHRYDDGWAWVWVRTDAERDAEGDAMGHCVGQGSYDRLGRGGAIVSLRDPAGRPHVTVQIAGVRRMQAQGRANTPPAEKYAARIADATVRVGAAVTEYGQPRWLDDVEAMAIVTEHVARNVRKTGHGPVMRIEIQHGVPAQIARAIAGR
ncbi:PcfJ domain-containing protein [Aureimonas sp. AU40]|uniref:PcfJ domain-containing protein n=1 Tax=Aureimonas sp. AU40 TaxID=1637747 RepID=UPI000783907D|nr:PcfJ domain-containing protein [Aureimonas sp. AU40]